MRKRSCFVLAFTVVVFLALAYGETASVQGMPFSSLATGGDVDSDGDGLTDRQESEGWEVIIDMYGYGTDAIGSLLTTRWVTSDPNVADTDGDGLSDREEFNLRTDPRNPDTDGDRLTDGAEWNQWKTNPLSVDTDGDSRGPGKNLTPDPALFDGNELLGPDNKLRPRATSPTLADTDGDGWTDYEESDNIVRDPLIADVPQLEIGIVDDVDVRLNIQYANAQVRERQYGGQLTTSKSESQSFTHSESLELSLALGADSNVSFFNAGAGFSTEFTVTAGASVSFEKASSQTVEKSYSDYTTDSRTLTETAATGSMTMGICLKNTGHITYTVSDLAYTVRMWKPGANRTNPKARGMLETVCTLKPDVGAMGDGITLAPGEVTPVIAMVASEVNASRIKDLLARPNTLYLEPAFCQIKNVEGIDFDFQEENIVAQTARFIIDPNYKNPKECRECRVATNVQRTPGGGYAGVRMETVLRGILGIDFEMDSPQSFCKIGDTANYRKPLSDTRVASGHWVVSLTRANPVEEQNDVDLLNMMIHAGDEVLFTFLEDRDGDGANGQQETHYGTSDSDSIDTDGDGLTDAEEICGETFRFRAEGKDFEVPCSWTVAVVGSDPYPVWSDPRQMDQDGDGWDDSMEKLKGTDPTLPDTDRDGLIDSIDPYPIKMKGDLFVKPGGTGDGRSWKTATSLEHALSLARTYNANSDPNDDVSEIWVAQGTYSSSNPDSAVFVELVDKVGIYGGFKGDGPEPETVRAQRDPLKNETVLSGGKTVVHAGSSVTSTATLDGFTVRDAAGNCGLLCEGGQPRLANLLITSNTSSNFGVGGGGARILMNGAAEMTLSNCIFYQNKANAGCGGGLYAENTASTSTSPFRLTLQDCEFTQNENLPNEANLGGGGGGAHFWRVTVRLDRCRFEQNRAKNLGGGVEFQTCYAIVRECMFNGNSVETVGGDGYAGGGIFVDASEITMANSVIWNNAADDGAGLYVWTSSTFSLVNCSIVDNYDKRNHQSRNYHSGGIKVHDWANTGTVENCILWGNESTHWYREHQYRSHGPWSPWLTQICDEGAYDALESVTLRNSCVMGSETNNPGQGQSVIWDDPAFVKEAAGNLRLNQGSLCIDRGDNHVDLDPLEAGFQLIQEIDLDGNPRVIDGDGVGGAIVDMGAYEYQGH